MSVWLDEKRKKSPARVFFTSCTTGQQAEKCHSQTMALSAPLPIVMPGSRAVTFLCWHWLKLPDHQSMEMGCPGLDQGQQFSESRSDPVVGVLFWSVACMEVCWVEIQPSAFVTHDFEAEVRRGDCSCLLQGHTPQGPHVPQAKCWSFEVLKWPHRKKKQRRMALQGCNLLLLCGPFCWQSHEKCWHREGLATGSLAKMCQALGEAMLRDMSWSLPDLSWGVGQAYHGATCPFAQQSYWPTSSSHLRRAKTVRCNWR